MTANNLTGPGNKRQVRMTLGQFPGPVYALHEVRVPDVLIEVTDAAVKPDHRAQWRCTVNSARRLRPCAALEDEAVEAAFAGILDDAQRALCLIPIFNDDVLEFLAQKFLDHRFVVALD